MLRLDEKLQRGGQDGGLVPREMLRQRQETPDRRRQVEPAAADDHTDRERGLCGRAPGRQLGQPAGAEGHWLREVRRDIARLVGGRHAVAERPRDAAFRHGWDGFNHSAATFENREGSFQDAVAWTTEHALSSGEAKVPRYILRM